MWQRIESGITVAVNADAKPPRDADPARHRASRLVGKTYAKGNEARRPFVTRLPASLYDRLMVASDATGLSANTLATEALEDYLSGPAFRARLGESLLRTDEAAGKRAQAEQRRQEAIRKLAGG